MEQAHIISTNSKKRKVTVDRVINVANGDDSDNESEGENLDDTIEEDARELDESDSEHSSDDFVVDDDVEEYEDGYTSKGEEDCITLEDNGEDEYDAPMISTNSKTRKRKVTFDFEHSRVAKCPKKF